MKKYLLLILGCFFTLYLDAQERCGSSIAFRNTLLANPAMQNIQKELDNKVADFVLNQSANKIQAGPYTLPVVVHIVHAAGTVLGTNENIDNAQVVLALSHLNSLFANSAPYDPVSGVNTDIQFCLAQQDPNGNATTGINRIASPLTDMIMESDDVSLKDLSRWNPNCYINIWVLRDICSVSSGCGVAGYAYFPSSHGTNIDGIVIEADYFGSSAINSSVLGHEMGHYLGLYHTFEGGCTNNDCNLDGDRVCDTPPDQFTGAINCLASYNSCTTDALSGFASDQNDMFQNYMDYGDPACYSIFTAGQTTRMQWHIDNVRMSLLSCQSCISPCPTPVVADFLPNGGSVGLGSTVNFSNNSLNALSYEWKINGSTFSTSSSPSYTFSAIGIYQIRLVAMGATTNCIDSMEVDLMVECPVIPAFTASSNNVSAGSTVTFTNTSNFTTQSNWYINNVLLASSTHLNYTFNTPGQYYVYLQAGDGNCNANSSSYLVNVGNNCSGVMAQDVGVCEGEAAQMAAFTGSISNPLSHHWYGAGMFLPNSTVQNPTYLPTASENTQGYANVYYELSYNYINTSLAPTFLAYGHSGNDDVYYVNTLTGNTSYITPNTENDWLATGFNPSTQELYGISCINGRYLWKANVTTGVVTQITFVDYPELFTGGDYDPVNNRFYGITSSQNVYIINTTNGSLTYVGNTGLPVGSCGWIYNCGGDIINGLAYDPSLDVLWGVSGDSRLYSISVSTGLATLIAPLSTTFSCSSLGYDFNRNELWASDYSFASSTLYQIDKNTGNIITTLAQSPSYPIVVALAYAPSTYSVPTLSYCGDSATIAIYPKPTPNLGLDTAVCALQSIELNANAYATNYLWQDGSTADSLLANAPGLYWVELRDGNNCVARDSVWVSSTSPLATLNLGPDISNCNGSVVALNAGSGFLQYWWNGIPGTSSFTAFNDGTYTVEALDNCGVRQRDTIIITTDPASIITLAPAIVCQNQTIALNANTGFVSYNWNPASTLSCNNCPNPTADPTGTTLYTVSATSASGCVSVASVEIEEQPCILPVFLSEWGGEALPSANRLYWKVETNQELKSFRLYKSLDGQHFSYLQSLSPNLNGSLSYSFEDKDYHATDYYQLITEDLDGADVRSSILELQHPFSASFLLYPSPTHSILNLTATLLESMESEVKIFDANARLVKRWEVSLSGGKNDLAFPVQDLAEGIYYLKLQLGTEEISRAWIKN